jgi:peptide/nickel transport system permease protein
VLWTDALLWLLVLALLVYAVAVWRSPAWRASWRRVWQDPAALGAAVVLAFFAAVTLLDSVHFRRALPPVEGARLAAREVFYATRTESLLDLLLSTPIAMRETSYSRPLAWQSFGKETVVRDGHPVREHVPLQHAGRHLADPVRQWPGDVAWRAVSGLAAGLALSALGWLGVAWWRPNVPERHPHPDSWRRALRAIHRRQTTLPLRAALTTFSVLCGLVGAAVALGAHYHVLGTDRTGNDVLVQALKSVRTAFVIGSLATLATLPFAITLGILAGYFKGWVDTLIQYLYSVLSSVPNVLLIAACVLMVQVYLDQNPERFETQLERADLKIVLLCLILGVTGWAGLCRLLRAETLKLRELDFVQAAIACGARDRRIMTRHILPNVMHLVLINTVLEFSALVLYEAVLSYVGVGVDPSMNSFGGMINLARSEMSRDPVVWWSFSAAFVFMVALVLAANLFADGVRQAFDPHAANWRVRWRRQDASRAGARP